MPTPYPKEQMHRIKYTKLTLEQIGGKLAALGGPTSASPLVAMAREQGGGIVTRTHHGAIEFAFVKHAGAWTVARATFRPGS